MKKDLIRIRNLGKDVYLEYKDEIAQMNYNTLLDISFLGAVICLLLFAGSFAPFDILSMRWGYFACAIIFALIFSICRIFLSNRMQYVALLSYATIGIFLWTGLLMGTVWDTQNCAITFIVFLVALPLFLVDNPIRLYVIFGIHGIIFCVLSGMVKPIEIARLDWINCAVFYGISMIVSWQVIGTKRDSIVAQKTLQKQRDMDALTQISNRAVCERAVMNYIGQTNREAVLLFLDLDNFKSINDMYGHKVGDILLQRFGEVLKQNFRTTDVVSRLGGDEFIVFIPYAEQFDFVIQKVARLMGCIENLEIPGIPEKSISASMGIVRYPRDGSDFDALYRMADMALYDAKRKGKKGYSVYDESMTAADGEEASVHANRMNYKEKRRILVVDDDSVNRSLLCKILADEYDTIEAENGQVALQIMEKEKDRIAVILLDLLMPVLNGIDFIDIFKGRMKKTTPIIVITQSNGAEDEINALSKGASDFLVKPYNAKLIKHRVRNLITLQENAQKITRIERDNLTGLYKKDVFFDKVLQLLSEHPEKQYDLICSDIEKFKMVNNMYGTAEGDQILRYMANILKRAVSKEGICGRLRDDVFAFVIPHDKKFEMDFFKEQIGRLNEYPINMNMEVDYGIYRITERNLPISVMCDNAIIAIGKIKGVYEKYYSYYNDELRNQMILEQEIKDCMEESLKNGDFKVYYQPKYDLMSSEIVGAEALVRWLHPKKGFMSPKEFIPLFERNGFITKMDRYVWEEVCLNLHQWIEAGNRPLPVSVNVSRTDIYDENVVNYLCDLLSKYELKPEYLHLEITETAYTENPEQIIHMVKELSGLGFKIEMDDFGTGYSSLSMLNDLPIDILKLDMTFVQNGKKGKDIIGFIIRLAQWLNLAIVAEGVETQEQVELLRSMDCRFVQGYFYAKPMPKPGFEELLKNNAYEFFSPLGGKVEEVTCPFVHENLNSRKVLIVDDIAVNRAVLVEVFRRKYTIVETENGRQAMDYIKLHAAEIEVILLDLIMPVMDGYEVIERLKRNPNTSNIPIIVTSGAAEDSEERALGMGVYDYIAKPYSGSIAKKRVENAIRYTKEMRKMEKYSYPRKGG